MLSISSTLSSVVSILLAFRAKDKFLPEKMSNSSAVELQGIISEAAGDNHDGAGESIYTVATELLKDSYNGRVPTTKKDLLAVNVDPNVASLLMQDVFGLSELVVSIHARKIVIALDMIDWEETGATLKSLLKTQAISVYRVKESLSTWLPKGEALHFHDVMESLGTVAWDRRLRHLRPGQENGKSTFLCERQEKCN